VLRLYRNRDAARRMAAAGQQSVRERFTIDRMVEQQVACYRRWLSDAQPDDRRAEQFVA
jgi:hypothetical protein